MILFQQRFHAAIRRGDITVTYRRWKTERVTTGVSYHCPPIGRIEIGSVDSVPVSTLRDTHARAAGFRDRAELLEALGTAETVYRIRFCYVGPEEATPAQEVTPQLVAQLTARLDQTDRRSRHGSWTREVLALIDEHPHTAASRLAPRLDWDTPVFKAHVRKLKSLGLTRSHAVGYELSELGKAVLSAAR